MTSAADPKRRSAQPADWEEEQDPLSAFSEAVALLYEAQIDGARAPAAREALKALLNADDIAVVTGAAGISEQRSEGRVLWVAIGEREHGPVRVQFRRHHAPFSPDDVAMLSRLRRHLRTAYSLGLLTNRDALGCLASTALTQSMVKGLLIVDSDCRIHWRNPAADGILASNEGLIEDKGRLRARRTFETARLEALAREAAGGRQGVMLVARPAEKHPYGLAFAPVKADARLVPAAAHAGTFVLITVKQMQREIALITARLGELFGFTPAEQRLGALLLDGCTLQEAAQLANKALATVKTQLRGMLKKTGAHSQAELINVFLSLPSVF
jgi:DNA-binding CsgD family transcriptional regulator